MISFKSSQFLSQSLEYSCKSHENSIQILYDLIQISPWETQSISSSLLIVGSQAAALFPPCYLFVTLFCGPAFFLIWATWLPNSPTQVSEPCLCLQLSRLFPYSSNPLPPCSKELNVDIVVFEGQCKFWIPLLFCCFGNIHTHTNLCLNERKLVPSGYFKHNIVSRSFLTMDTPSWKTLPS